MLTRSRGLVLRAPADTTSGEYDGWRQGFSRRDVRRLVGAGLVARDGLAADQLLHEFDGCHDMNADEFVSWWMAEGLRGLDIRAARRSGVTSSDERPDDAWDEYLAESVAEPIALAEVCAAAPEWFAEWCARIVHGPKLDVLTMLGAAEWCGSSAPAPINAAWYPKLVGKFARRCGR